MAVEQAAPPWLGRTRITRQILLPATVLVLAFGMIYYYNGVLIAIRQRQFPLPGALQRGNVSDLYPRWLGARELLLHGRNPYSPEITREIQRGFYGRPLDPSNRHDPTDSEAFAYPVYVVFLLAPSLHFSFDTVRIVFTVVLLMLTAASFPLWLRALRLSLPPRVALMAFVATMSSFAVVDGLHLEQITLLVAALLAGCIASLVAGRLVMAGVLLAVTTVKPQLTILVVAFLLLWTWAEWRSRKWFAVSFGSLMAAFLIGAELALPGWFRFWLQSAQEYIGSHKPSLLASLLGHRTALVVGALAIFFCGVVCWRFRRKPAGSGAFNFALVSALAVTALLLPNVGSAYYNQVLLLPAVAWLLTSGWELAKNNPLARFTWLAAVNLLAWEWILALPVALATLVLRHRFEREGTLFVAGPELLTFLFPLALALFVMSVAPQVCLPRRKATTRLFENRQYRQKA